MTRNIQRLLSGWPLFKNLIKEHKMFSNFNYFWNFGSLAALTVGIQVVTGVLLAMHYSPDADTAFASVEHIMRDVPHGYLIRYIHANGASLFFFAVYFHMARAIWYASYGYP